MPRARLAIAAALGLSLWAVPALAEGPPVAGVEIETGAAELASSDAGEFWADLDADLGGAIDTRLEGRMADNGAHVRVRIDRVALSNAYEMMQADGAPFLEGRVTVIGPTLSDSQPLRITPVGAGDAPDDAAAQYTALIEAFADGVVAVLD